MQYPGGDIKPHQHHRADLPSLVDKFRATVIGQVAPRPFYNSCANTWSTPCCTPWVSKELSDQKPEIYGHFLPDRKSKQKLKKT